MLSQQVWWAGASKSAQALCSKRCRTSEHVTDTNADLLIKNVTVVSVGHEMTSVAADVLVRDGKIVFIGDLDADGVSDAATTIDRGISLQPTVQVLYGEQDIHNPEYLDDPRLAYVLPTNVLARYRTNDGQRWRQ